MTGGSNPLTVLNCDKLKGSILVINVKSIAKMCCLWTRTLRKQGMGKVTTCKGLSGCLWFNKLLHYPEAEFVLALKSSEKPPLQLMAWNNTHIPCREGVFKQGNPRENGADPLWSVCRDNELQSKSAGLICPSGQPIWS